MANNEEKIWYAVIQNKADGPHTKNSIQQMLDGGKLSFTDFVFKPGMDSWTPIGNVKDFERRDFNKATQIQNPLPQDDREGWVVLLKHINESGKQTLIQQGPLTTEQVRDKLLKEEVKYDDYVWQKGFSEWKKLGVLDIFDRRRPQNFEKQPKPDFSQDKTVSGVEVKQEETKLESVKKSNRITKLVISIGAAAVGMLVVYVGLNAYKQTLITLPVKDKNQATQVKVAPQLKVSSIKSNTPSKPQLVFETNLTQGSKIQVELVAELGDILNYPRLNLERELTVVSGQLPILDLSNEDLPEGTYKVKASGQGLYSQTSIKVGVHDQALAEKLSSHKKGLIAQAQKEKALMVSSYQLFASSQNKLNQIHVSYMKKKNKKQFNQSLAVFKKDLNSKLAKNTWYEKSNTKSLIYPQAQPKYTMAKAKLIELTQTVSKLNNKRSIASAIQPFEEYKKTLNDLQMAIKTMR
ncbi:MAG: DUF4339 domain-containing protein [Oligoflexia bacterium]|nr:DUF4339 domain-containing protein [Oligoflexia bacterium]